MSVGRKSKRQVDQVRRRIFDRDGGCVVQGSSFGLLWPCGGPLTIQHRVKRGFGSSAEYDAPELLIAMCAIHNSLDASHQTFREASLRCGWSMPRWVLNVETPGNVPVRYGSEWCLLDGFSRVTVDSVTAEGIMGRLYRNTEPTHIR